MNGQISVILPTNHHFSVGVNSLTKGEIERWSFSCLSPVWKGLGHFTSPDFIG